MLSCFLAVWNNYSGNNPFMWNTCCNKDSSNAAYLTGNVQLCPGLKKVTKSSSKLEWHDDSSINISHNITENGNYFVYVQVTFRGECSENLLLKITLCKKEEKIREKELLVTSMSVCENMNRTNWTRTLSQAAIFYFEKGDEIYINTTTMKYVDFNHNYNNIFGIYKL
ncbi:tumor necrosis factor ligand superfamily member 15-like isoform X2 [Heterodontus francisci]|uniref:tumor necrosis factor ligand superfamily member 15-like isoform X2 n=1 Tax=Heterodontus francisci TaxID=7792 RepID=UPI00355BF3D2